MKLLFARIICLQAVILLTSGILFGAIDQKNSSNSSFKKLHFSQKSEINFESFSFFEGYSLYYKISNQNYIITKINSSKKHILTKDA
jgi:hypothetical protein